MLNGYVLTHGEKAITIQTEEVINIMDQKKI